jgi:hypothetical protein
MEEFCCYFQRLHKVPAVPGTGSILRPEIEQGSTRGQTDGREEKAIFATMRKRLKQKFYFEVHDANITKERKEIH